MVKYHFFVCKTDAQVESFNVALENIMILMIALQWFFYQYKINIKCLRLFGILQESKNGYLI